MFVVVLVLFVLLQVLLVFCKFLWYVCLSVVWLLGLLGIMLKLYRLRTRGGAFALPLSHVFGRVEAGLFALLLFCLLFFIVVFGLLQLASFLG